MTMHPRITLKDIARRLNLSVAAVSMALHNAPSISEAQRKKIHKVAELLGYRPDPGLSALSAYRHKSGFRPAFAQLAFAEFNLLGHSWTDTFYHGANEQAERLGYQLNYYHLCSSLPLKRHSEILQAQGVRGLILGPMPDGINTIDFDWFHFTVIAIGRSLLHPELHRAAPDAFEALLLAVDKIRSSSRGKIGIAITREQDCRVGSVWSAAGIMMQERMRQNGESIAFFEDSENRPARFLSWLRREKPKIVVSLLHPIPDWIQKAGYSIPRDLELVVLDNDHEMSRPGIEQNFKVVGAAAMNLLHSSLLQGETGIPEHRQTILVQPRWTEANTASHQSN